MLTVNEIFHSIQGESSWAGLPCVFVRLTACDLRCAWCDTPYAFAEGTKRTVEDVVRDVQALGCPLVEVTGGEPLLQPDVYPLMERLLAAGFQVLRLTYTNATLFPIVAAVRLAQRATGVAASDADEAAAREIAIPPAPVNAFLSGLLTAEAALVRGVNMPFGSSLAALARAV